MKKLFISLFVACAAVFLAAFGKGLSIRAYAVNDISFEVHELSSVPANYPDGVQAGDYEIMLFISNFDDVGGAGIEWEYDKSVFSVRKQNNTEPIRRLGNVGGLCEVTCNNFINNPNNALVGVSWVNGDGFTQNNGTPERLISFFLYKNSSANLTPAQIEAAIYTPEVINMNDPNTNGITDYSVSTEYIYTDAVSYCYILGDINDDGNVNVADVQLIQAMINAYNNAHPGTPLYTDANTGNLFPNSGNYIGLYVEINGIDTLLLKVADVNFDNVIDSTDVGLALQYYSYYVLGQYPYDGEIGTLMTEVVYVLSSSAP